VEITARIFASELQESDDAPVHARQLGNHDKLGNHDERDSLPSTADVSKTKRISGNRQRFPPFSLAPGHRILRFSQEHW
jgi:hypothetical protein